MVIADGIVTFIIGFLGPGVERVSLKGFSNSLGEDTYKAGV